jgi:hypothetical protein
MILEPIVRCALIFDHTDVEVAIIGGACNVACIGVLDMASLTSSSI